MKLIDLLVQELPKRGGWPSWALEACNQNMGRIMFYNSEGGIDGDSPEIFIGIRDDQSITEEVTRHQYETALAASERVGWNGFHLPPVGTECEYLSVNEGWVNCEILLYRQNFVVMETSLGGGGITLNRVDECQFRPIRTEAERKRDDAIEALQLDEARTGVYINEDEATAIYDAIAAGEIPGVKLED